MPRSIELLTYPDRITFFRRGWGKKIEMKVSVSENKNGDPRVFSFPATDKSLSIDGLDNQRAYKIKIKGGSLLSQFTNRSRSLKISKIGTSPRILIIGSGRCGTTSIANFLDGLEFSNGKPVFSRHETLFEYVLQAIINGDRHGVVNYYKGFWHDIESSPHLTPFAGELPAEKVLHIIRDGRRVVQSGVNRGWYQKDDIWERIKPSFEGSVFEKACRFWTHMINQAEKYATKTIRLEDIASSQQSLSGLLSYLDIRPTDKRLPIANTGKVSSSFQDWDKTQKAQFADICGAVMDKYYPNWRDA